LKKEDITKKAIQDNLIDLRTSYNLTHKEMAEALGIERSTYSSWEAGRSCPKPAEIVKIAKMFSVSSDRILGIEGKSVLRVSASGEYNKDIYGDAKFSDLSNYEKKILLKLRILNADDKSKVAEFIENLKTD
jgi:DNA-binding XRE family transcriptional regulator